MDLILLRDVSPESPSRRPDRRWFVAEHYAQAKRRLPRRWHDKWTAKAKQFQLRWTRDGSDQSHSSIVSRYNDSRAAKAAPPFWIRRTRKGEFLK